MLGDYCPLRSQSKVSMGEESLQTWPHLSISFTEFCDVRLRHSAVKCSEKKKVMQ